MAERYFAVMMNGNAPAGSVAVDNSSGTWIGVVKISDPAEADRVAKICMKEITQQQYEADLKKKAEQLSASENYRHVASSLSAPPVAKASVSNQPPQPQKELLIQDIRQPTPVPRRRSTPQPPPQ